jgi:superfamily II DNA or RNA helicase
VSIPSARNLLARFTTELIENDPSFFIYSAQNHLGNFKPYIHQQLLLWRLSLLEKLRVVIGDEIGLGKTVEAILTIKYLQKRGVKRFLLLLPRSLKRQWKGELKKFFPEIEIHELNSKNIPILFRKDAGEGVYLVSIDTAKTDQNSEFLRKVKWDVVIVDEAHNLGSDTQKDVLVSRLETDNLIFLSATPHRGDTKRYLKFLAHLDKNIKSDREEFNSSDFFRKTHNSLIHRRTKKVVNEVEEVKVFPSCNVMAVVTEASNIEKQFGNDISDFLTGLLRNRDDDSPVGLLVALLRKRASSSPRAAIKTLERIIQPKSEYTDERETVAEKLLGESFEDVGEVIEKMDAEDVDEVYELVLEKYKYQLSPGEISRLADFIDMARKIERDKDSKVEALKDILNNHIKNGEKVIVFTEYRDTLDYLEERLRVEYSIVTAYGRLGEEELSKRFEEFIKNRDVLIATDIASEGLNLQEANVVVNYEPPWTPIKLEQRIGRVWRMGQKKDVLIYNLFLGTRSDIELAKILYGKMLSIVDALSDVKNVIGEDIQWATSRVIGSVEEMIDTSYLPTSVRYRNKIRRVTEHHLISAQLKGELDEFVDAIIDQIKQLRYELSSKRIYPVENAQNIKSLGEKLGLVPMVKNEEILREVVSNVLCRESIKLWSELNKLRKECESSPEYLLVSGDKDGVDYVVIAEVDLGGNKLRIPFMFSNNQLLLGAKALRYLAEVSKMAVVPDEVYTRETLEPNIYAVKNRLIDVLNPLMMPYRDYGLNTEIKDIRINILCKILKIEVETLSTSREYAINVGISAEKFVEEYEKKRGCLVDSRQSIRKYDLYSFREEEADKPEGCRDEERYIEVKGHGKGGEWFSMSAEEFEFGKSLGSKYWLYIVWNMFEGNPVLVAFKDPFNRGDFFDVTQREREVVTKTTYYQIKFKYFDNINNKSKSIDVS